MGKVTQDRSKPGQVRDCTEPQVAAVFRALNAGLPFPAACESAGTTPESVTRWCVRHRPGRKTRCTAEVAYQVLEHVRNGLSIVQACKAAHVPRSVYYFWRENARTKGKDPHGDYRRFLEDSDFAKAEGLGRAARCVSRAMDGDPKYTGQWQAAMTYLERRDPAHWAKRDPLAVNVERTIQRELQSAVSVLKDVLAPDQFERAVAALTMGSGLQAKAQASTGSEPSGPGQGSDPR